ncbi:MAG: sensor domain-containing protein, partial [Euryarchaeota archaeon]|nr:sensor domain-containing protein [Euryarchaeota archaeon]
MTASKERGNNKMALLTELLTLWFQERTWRSAAYLLLSLPLGIVYFTFVVTATSLSGGMMVTLAGVPLLVGTFIGVRALAKFDAKIGNSIQRTNITLPPATWEEGNLRTRIEKTIKSRATWKSFVYMLA